MSVWQGVRGLIDACDADGVAQRMIELGPGERREVARELPRHLKEVQNAWASWRGAGDKAEAIRAAAVGCLSEAADVASWLTRRGVIGADDYIDDAHRLLPLIRKRPMDWQANLATRLAQRLHGRDSTYSLAATLIRETGVQAPTDDVFVYGWVSDVNRQCPLAEQLADDPLLDALLPQIFRAEGVGEALQWEDDPASPYSWLGALCALAAEGRVERAVLLDGCLGRLSRGGTASQLRFFMRLHAALEVTPAEAGARAHEYLRLLPSSPSPVAYMALQHLRQSPPPAPEVFAEAIGAAMLREETQLVLAGLAWADQIVRLAPGYSEPVTAALVTAFNHESSHIQKRAVQLAIKHVTRLDKKALRKATVPLKPDLRWQFLNETSPITILSSPLPAMRTALTSVTSAIDSCELDQLMRLRACQRSERS